jgi:hypothetical protein
MTDEQKLTLWLGSFRYYCGRMSYAVSNFCDLLLQEWPNIPKATQDLIRRDLDEEIARDNRSREKGLGIYPLGQDMDRAEWLRVRGKI